MVLEIECNYRAGLGQWIYFRGNFCFSFCFLRREQLNMERDMGTRLTELVVLSRKPIFRLFFFGGGGLRADLRCILQQ